MLFFRFFFFKQKTAYEMRISDWSSDVCSSDLLIWPVFVHAGDEPRIPVPSMPGVVRHSVPALVDAVGEAAALGIPMVAVFPLVDPSLKDPQGGNAVDPDNVVCRAVRAIKAAGLDIGVMRSEERSVGKEGVSTCRSRW